MKKLIALLCCVVLFCCCFTGCGTSSAAWDYVAEKGELIVGLDDTFIPMGFRDEAGELVGFDIDFANAVGEYLGVKIKFQPIDWNSKEMELSSKRIDCIWNGMSATPARQKEMALTKKYLQNQLIIMTNAGVTVATKADLANLNVGVQEGSAALEAMQADKEWDSFKDKVKEYPTYDTIILEMQAGRIDCMVVDKTLGDYKNTKLGGIFGTSEVNFGDDYYAIGCRKGETALADKLNEAIKALIDNGKADEISTKWFGRNLVVFEGY